MTGVKSEYDMVVVFFQHHIYTLLVLMWVLSNAANAMSAPGPQSGQFYKWLYGFLQTTLGAVPRLLATMFPAQWAALTGKSTITEVK